MYKFNVLTTAGPPSTSLMLVNPAKSPNKIVASRSTPPMESALGFSDNISTNCGDTRARNCLVTRCFSRLVITAIATVVTSHALKPLVTGAAIGKIHSP